MLQIWYVQFSYKTLFTQTSHAERVTKPKERLRGRLWDVTDMIGTVLLQDAVYSNLPRRTRDEAQRTSAWEAVFTRNIGICVQPREVTWFSGERTLSSQGCRN